MIRPFDQQRFAGIVGEFIARGNFAPPFHLIAISRSNGSVIVSYNTDTLKEVCRNIVGRGMAPPITLTVVDASGRSATGLVELVDARPTLQ